MVAALIILACCVPVTAFVMGHFVMKAMQHGLKWQIETKREEKPTMEKALPNPFQPQPKEMPISTIFDEWVNGEKEREVN